MIASEAFEIATQYLLKTIAFLNYYVPKTTVDNTVAQ